MRVLAALLALVPFAVIVCRADDWPQWRGPNRDGIWRESGIVEKFDKPQLDIQWRAEIGPGYSGPTVANGRVYVTNRQTEPKQVERVLCFRAADGKPIWSHTYGCSYEGVQYTAGPRAAVTIDEGHAYSLGTMDDLFCFDAATGDILWQKDLRRMALPPMVIGFTTNWRPAILPGLGRAVPGGGGAVWVGV